MTIPGDLRFPGRAISREELAEVLERHVADLGGLDRVLPVEQRIMYELLGGDLDRRRERKRFGRLWKFERMITGEARTAMIGEASPLALPQKNARDRPLAPAEIAPSAPRKRAKRAPKPAKTPQNEEISP